MKKLIVLLLLGMLSTSIFAGEDTTTLTVKANKQPNFKITKHWKLNTWSSWIYLISNPTHSELNFAFEIYPTSRDQEGHEVPSAAIKLTCGDQVFFVTEYSPTGMTVCKTKDDIRFELVSVPGNPSNGKFELQQ